MSSSNTYVTHKHLVFMTLNRNINWLKSTYVNLHCAGNKRERVYSMQWVKELSSLYLFSHVKWLNYNIVVMIMSVIIVYYAGEKNFNNKKKTTFIANTFDAQYSKTILFIRTNYACIVTHNTLKSGISYVD